MIGMQEALHAPMGNYLILKWVLMMVPTRAASILPCHIFLWLQEWVGVCFYLREFFYVGFHEFRSEIGVLMVLNTMVPFFPLHFAILQGF